MEHYLAITSGVKLCPGKFYTVIESAKNIMNITYWSRVTDIYNIIWVLILTTVYNRPLNTIWSIYK